MTDRPLRKGNALPTATLGKIRRPRFTYDAALLEAVPYGLGRDFGAQSVWVSNLCQRFTSLCPVTGQPDWAVIHLNYIPQARLVESKSLKEYLQSFRMHGDFHEDVCRIICDDLVELLAPRYLEILGEFDSRGSIAIWPYVSHARAEDGEAQAILSHRRLNYAPGAYGPRHPPQA
jgi:7-cyano-7-deazaguanine reductase